MNVYIYIVSLIKQKDEGLVQQNVETKVLHSSYGRKFGGRGGGGGVKKFLLLTEGISNIVQRHHQLSNYSEVCCSSVLVCIRFLNSHLLPIAVHRHRDD